MKMRWVAPPNWPPMPEGFEPPAGWHPDPTWPPPPAGWQFWQPAEVDVHAGLPWWHRMRRRYIGLALPVVLILVLLGVNLSHHDTKQIDSGLVQHQIEKWMTKNLGSTDPLVTCPTGVPAEKDKIFICQATDSTGRARFAVTVLNSDGYVQWQLER